MTHITVQPTTLDSNARRPVSAKWATWLIVWTEAVAAFTLLCLVWRSFNEKFFNLVAFGSADTPDTFSQEALDYQRLLFSIIGGLTIGWMVLVWFVAKNSFKAGERWAWTALTVSLLTWWVLDSTFSIIAGFPENAALNTVFLAGAIPPLAATRR